MQNKLLKQQLQLMQQLLNMQAQAASRLSPAVTAVGHVATGSSPMLQGGNGGDLSDQLAQFHLQLAQQEKVGPVCTATGASSANGCLTAMPWRRCR